MSFIHYKLITNQNYEKVTFDGVSLSVNDLKKIVLEKKFRKSTGPATATNPNGTFNKKGFDVDLEVTNVDTNEVYQKDTDLIPKNSHVQINRVVKNIGPAISGKIVTSTHQESERLADFINKQQKLQDKLLKIDDDIKKPIENINSSSMLYNDLIQPITVSIPSTNSSSQDLKKDLSPNESLYADLLNDDDNNSNSSFQGLSNDILLNKINDISPNKSSYKDLKEIKPPTELLCPFEDLEKKERHLMSNAVIAPCCGYFICCEKCIQEKIAQNFFVECPREDCLQEISSYHRLTPYKPMRLKIKEYLSNNNQAPSTFPSSLFADQLKPKETSNIVSPNFDNKLPASKEKPSPPATSSVKINISSNKIITTIKGSSSLNSFKKQANESPEKLTTSPVYDDLIDMNPIDDSNKPKLEDVPIKEETNKAEPDINNKSPLSMVSEDRKSRSRSISSVSSSSSRSSSSASNKSVKTGESGISKVSSALSEETAKINEKSSPKSRSKSSNSSVSSRSVSRSPSRSTPSLKDEKLNDQPTNTNISANNSAVSASTNPAFAPGAELNPSFQQNYFYNNNANPIGYYNQPPKQFTQIPPPTVMPPNAMYPQGPIEPFYNQQMYPANNRLFNQQNPPPGVFNPSIRMPPNGFTNYPGGQPMMGYNPNAPNFPNGPQMGDIYMGQAQFNPAMMQQPSRFTHPMIGNFQNPNFPMQMSNDVNRWNMQAAMNPQFRPFAPNLNFAQMQNLASHNDRSKKRSRSRSRGRSDKYKSSRSNRKRSHSRHRSRTRSRSRSLNRYNDKKSYKSRSRSPRRGGYYKNERERRRSKSPNYARRQSSQERRNRPFESRYPNENSSMSLQFEQSQASKHQSYYKHDVNERERNSRPIFEQKSFRRERSRSRSRSKSRHNRRDDSRERFNREKRNVNSYNRSRSRNRDYRYKEEIRSDQPKQFQQERAENEQGLKRNSDELDKNSDTNENEAHKKEKTYHKLNNLRYKPNSGSSSGSDDKPSGPFSGVFESNNKFSNNQTEEKDNSIENAKKRFVFLFKGSGQNGGSSNESKPVEINSNQTDKESVLNAAKTTEPEDEKQTYLNNKSLNIQKDYHSYPSNKQNETTKLTVSKIDDSSFTLVQPVKNTIINLKSSSRPVLTNLATSSSSSTNTSPVSSPKKPKRRVYLKHELTSPLAKAAPVKLNDINSQPKPSSLDAKIEEEADPKPVKNEFESGENVNSTNGGDEEYLDISINEKDSLNAI